MSSIEVRKRTSSVHWVRFGCTCTTTSMVIYIQDEHNLRQNNEALSLSRASSLRRPSLMGEVPSIVQYRDSLDGATSPGPWDVLAVSPSSNSFPSSMDGMLSGRAFARVSSCSGRSPDVPGSPGNPWRAALPASKQQLLSAKRTASGRLAPDAVGLVDAGMARPLDPPQQQRSVKKSSSLREGSGFVHNALAVGRVMLQQEGLADNE